MKRSIAILALSAITACQPPPVVHPGEEPTGRCYPGFIEEMSSLVPDGAARCGIFSQRDTSGEACAKAAAASPGPYLFGYQSRGDDSTYCHAAARDESGQVFEMYYDAGIAGDGSDAFIQISRCSGIAFRPGTIGVGSFFDAEGCKDAPDLVQGIVDRRHGE